MLARKGGTVDFSHRVPPAVLAHSAVPRAEGPLLRSKLSRVSGTLGAGCGSAVA